MLCQHKLCVVRQCSFPETFPATVENSERRSSYGLFIDTGLWHLPKRCSLNRIWCWQRHGLHKLYTGNKKTSELLWDDWGGCVRNWMHYRLEQRYVCSQNIDGTIAPARASCVQEPLLSHTLPIELCTLSIFPSKFINLYHSLSNQIKSNLYFPGLLGEITSYETLLSYSMDTLAMNNARITKNINSLLTLNQFTTLLK